MTSILGLWQINANNSPGILRLFQDSQGNVQGKITFQDTPRIDNVINVSWNDAAGEITFVRQLGQSGVTQAYLGFLGDNHPDQFLYLAGAFTESDTPVNAQRFQFGWFARQAQPPPVPAVTIVGKTHIEVFAGELQGDPTVESTYTVQITGNLVDISSVTWTGDSLVRFTNPNAQTTEAIFDMTGETDPGSGQTFQIMVTVVDSLGSIANYPETVEVLVKENKGG
jgi:hypothetical protein